MATTKVVTAIASGLTMTAGAGDVTSTAVNLEDGYGGFMGLKITNGATTPTIPGQIEVQTSQDNSEWFTLAIYVADLGNSIVTSWTIPIDIGVEYVRIITGSNTAQDTTADVDISEVTAVS
jgi:hypothetical protein